MDSKAIASTTVSIDAGPVPSKKSKKKNKQNKQQQQPSQPQQNRIQPQTVVADNRPPQSTESTARNCSSTSSSSNQPAKPLASAGSTVRTDPNNGQLLVCRPASTVCKSIAGANPRAPLDPTKPSDIDLDRLEAEYIHPLLKPAQKFPRALYQCRQCAVHIDNLSKAWDHVDSTRHRIKSETQMLQRFVAAAPPPTVSHCEGVGEHLKNYSDSMLLTEAEAERRQIVANRSIEAIRSSGGGRSARIYGSLISHLSTIDSDVNLSLVLVDAATMADSKSNADAEFNVAFERCVDALTAATVVSTEIEKDNVIKLFASVESQADNLAPAILCKDTSGVAYRFSVNTWHRSLTSNLIAAYTRLDERCRRLCFALRTVANLAKADAPQRGTLPPHAYHLMVVHYLQQVGVLPVLNSLATMAPPDCCTSVNFEDGKLTYFSADPDRLAEFWQPTDAARTANLGRLWIDLLRYYSTPRQDAIVCVTQLEPLLCSAKDWMPKRLNIEDPFRPRMNMSRGVASSELLDYILMQIRSAYRYYAVPQLATGPLYQHFKLKASTGGGLTKTQKLKITPLFDIGDLVGAARQVVDSVPGIASTSDIVNAALASIFSPDDQVSCASLELDEADLAAGVSTDSNKAPSVANLPTVDFHRWLVQRLFGAIMRRHLARDCLTATPAQAAAIIRVAVRSSRRRRQRRLLIRRRRRLTTNELPVPPPLQLISPTKPEPTTIEQYARQIVDNLVADCLSTVVCGTAANVDLDGVNLSIVDDVLEEEDYADEDQIGNDDDEDLEEAANAIDEAEDAEIDEELAAEGGVLDSTDPDYYNRALVESVNKASLRYTLDKRCLVRAPPPQLQCASCGKAGHLKDACTEYEFVNLSEQLPVPCSAKHLSSLTELLRTVPGDFEERPIDLKKRAEVKDEILALLRVHFPDAQLELFGSCCNGFGFFNSDLDMCLTFDNCPTLSSLKTPVPDIITKVAKILKGAPSRQFYSVLPITQAKVPIVKFHHRRFDCEGDVSLYNRLAAANTRMLRTYAMLDRRVRDLGYIVKVFAKSCDIGDASRGSLSSYAYVILTLHYLQSEGVIPCLQELYDGWPSQAAPVRQIDGWNAWFQEDRAEIARRWRPRCDKNIGELWLGFLRYYLEFDWRSKVVTIRRSGPLLRLEKLWSTPLAIEDPFELCHNLASGMTKKMAWFILTTFHNALKRWCSPPVEPLADRAMKEYLFSSSLCPCDVPKDRGCKRCGKIGHIARDCGHEMKRANRLDGIRTPLKDFQREQVQIDQQSRPQLAPAEDGPTGGPAILYMRQSSSASSADPASPAPQAAAYQPVLIRAPGMPDLLVPLAQLPTGPQELRLLGNPQTFPVFNWMPASPTAAISTGTATAAGAATAAPAAPIGQQQWRPVSTLVPTSGSMVSGNSSLPIGAVGGRQPSSRQFQPLPPGIIIQRGGGGPPMPIGGFQQQQQQQQYTGQLPQHSRNVFPNQQQQQQQQQKKKSQHGNRGAGGDPFSAKKK